METIEPYDFKGIRPFAMPYLADTRLKNTMLTAKPPYPGEGEGKAVYGKLDPNTIMGYSSVTVSSSEVLFNNSRVEYALLPVWLLTFIMRGKATFCHERPDRKGG